MDKVCTKCGECKPFEEYYKDKRHLTGRYSACKTCARKATQDWADKHPDMKRAALKRSLARPGNREKKNARDRRYSAANTATIVERVRNWREANPDKAQAERDRNSGPQCARRRARKRAALCECCQNEEAKADIRLVYGLARKLKMHVDHVRPLAKGGLHCLNNLQLLTPKENLRKHAKWQEAA